VRKFCVIVYSCSLDGQDGGGQQMCLESHADGVEATRTVRESPDRAAAAATATTTSSSVSVTPLTASTAVNNGHCIMYTRRVTTDQRQSNDDNDKIQSSLEVETKPEPEIGRLSLNGDAENRSDELARENCRSASANVVDEEAPCRPGPDVRSSTPQPEVVTRRPVAALDRKSACQEPITERFDRVVQYFDSRQHISGKTGHSSR